ncbi:hypothetical protein MASR2M17_02470 [Aminivibrio sp.]
MKKYLVSLLVVIVFMSGAGGVCAGGGERNDGIKTFGEVLQEVGILSEGGAALHAGGQLSREEMVTIINRLYSEKAPGKCRRFRPHGGIQDVYPSGKRDFFRCAPNPLGVPGGRIRP